MSVLDAYLAGRDAKEGREMAERRSLVDNALRTHNGLEPTDDRSAIGRWFDNQRGKPAPQGMSMDESRKVLSTYAPDVLQAEQAGKAARLDELKSTLTPVAEHLISLPDDQQRTQVFSEQYLGGLKEKFPEFADVLDQVAGPDRILSQDELQSFMSMQGVGVKKPEPKQRQIETDALGIKRYVDSGEQVFSEDAPKRVMKEDPNGVLRYTDSGEEVFGNIAKNPEKADFKDIAKLRGEYTSATNEFGDINSSYGRVIASAQDPSPAGDMALIFNYMKMLDPGSVVRESEFATAARTGDYGDRIQALVQRVTSGNRLSDGQRKDFVTRSDKLFRQALKQHQKTTSEYTRLAERFNMDPEDVIVDRKTVDTPEQAPVVMTHPQYGDVTEADIQTTMQNHGLSREEVLARLDQPMNDQSGRRDNAR